LPKSNVSRSRANTDQKRSNYGKSKSHAALLRFDIRRFKNFPAQSGAV